MNLNQKSVNMNKKILIVEDEFVVANALRLTLVQAGYTVSGIAASAEEAEAYLQEQQPDIVLLDIRLNGARSGIELARKLKDANIAFIYLSANSSQKILEEANQTDPYGFIVKPFREKDLLVALDIAIYRQKNSVEARSHQEVLLQKQLLAIGKEEGDVHQQFLKVARAIQAFIPFDLISWGMRPLHAETFNDHGYLRTGFDEYQSIGEKELMTIGGLTKSELSGIVKNNEAALPGNGTVYDHSTAPALQKVWFDCFRMGAALVFPVLLSDGSAVQYSFYRRQRHTYSQTHTDLLGLFAKSLSFVTEKIITADLPAVSTAASVSGRPHSTAARPGEFATIIGKHPLLLAALDLVAQVAPYNTSVLILGESGTGKEKIVQSIHALSTRKSAPFVQINCGAIPAALIESELFGHEKGAFTGAVEKRKGKFEQADGGTVFLDEIGELPLDMQVKLLRVLQEKEISYIGSHSPRKVDVRIVAATNLNLEKEVADGRFRLDLYYRLNVFPITLPPLRERKSDIADLAVFFANKFCDEFNKDFNGISATMMDEMHAYHWPGNIRELENVMERAVILNDGRSALQLKQSLNGKSVETTVAAAIETLDDVKQVQRETEKAYLISVLKKADGRIRGHNGAAELLDIKPTTLESKMAKLGIRREDFFRAD